MAASDMANSVVGIFMNRMPRLNVAAAKPPKSDTTPPPMFTNSDRRVAPNELRSSHTPAKVSRLLLSSPAGTTMTVPSQRNSGLTFESVSTNTLSGCSLSISAESSSRHFIVAYFLKYPPSNRQTPPSN